MKVVISQEFTTKTGKILKVGDVVEVEDEGVISRLIEKGRARPLPPAAHENAPSCPEREAGQPIAPPEGETSSPAPFSIGQRVRFSHLRALNVLEGSIIEMQWHPAPISRWWYRVQVGEEKFWISESHIVTTAGADPRPTSDRRSA